MEQLKPIQGYEGLYEVSDQGNVRSLNHSVFSPTRNPEIVKTRVVKGKVLKPEVKANGYLYVNLWKEGVKKAYSVHRLVAKAFIDNPLKKPCVNHKDYNRKNACADNLEWVTTAENIQYSASNLSEAHIGKSSVPNKTGEMYINKTPNGHYRLRIGCLRINRTYKTLDEAVNVRRAIMGW